MNQLQGVSRIRLAIYLDAGVELPRWDPDWGKQLDARFFWPGDDFNAGVTGTLIQTTWNLDFAPRQPACIWGEQPDINKSNSLHELAKVLRDSGVK